MPPNFDDMFESDISRALNVSRNNVHVVSVSNLQRVVDVSVQFDVDLQDTEYEDPDMVELEIEDQLEDPDSTLMQGNVTQYIEPTSFEVVTVYIPESSSFSESTSLSSTDSSISSFSLPSSDPPESSVHELDAALTAEPFTILLTVLCGAMLLC